MSENRCYLDIGPEEKNVQQEILLIWRKTTFFHRVSSINVGFHAGFLPSTVLYESFGKILGSFPPSNTDPGLLHF